MSLEHLYLCQDGYVSLLLVFPTLSCGKICLTNTYHNIQARTQLEHIQLVSNFHVVNSHAFNSDNFYIICKVNTYRSTYFYRDMKIYK